VFGPVVTFGAGGLVVEVVGDRAVALPPLNHYLVRNLIEGTHAARMLGPFRRMPPADLAALESVLLRVSEMVCELPHIRELDINPLIVDEHGIVAVDARMVVDFPRPSGDRYAHMAIHPYPAHLVSRQGLSDGTELTIRPIRPEDADIEQAFIRGLSQESRYFRFISALQELSPAQLARFTQIDYDREMALIAVLERETPETQIGVARYITNPDGESCEFALVVADAWQHKGVGHRLMDSLMDVARGKGLKRMIGDVLASNRNMLNLVSGMGFSIGQSEEDPAFKRVVKRF
jgi:acetyltransferase